MVRYIKCPRCELNYIDAEKQEYCDICLKEMKGIRTDFDDFEEEEDSELLTELCPVCGENMMRAGEKMCEECRKKADYEERDEAEDDDAEDAEWREYLDDTADMDDELEDIGEKFDEGEEEDEEEDELYEGVDDEEDMEYVTGDEIYALAGDDEDDDEDEDDDF